jgi:hypothetical protein
LKQALSKEREIEVVQRCAGDKYAQMIVLADGLAKIQSQRNATALELNKTMRKSWQITGNGDGDEEDDDIKDDSVGLKT